MQSIALLLLLVTLESTKVYSRQSLQTVSTFDDEEAVSSKAIDRNKKSSERINLSFPGTKWYFIHCYDKYNDFFLIAEDFRCGPGNTADNYDDLGSDEAVDSCCRQHDHCDNIASGEEKYGLKNTDFFTRLHCQCDKEFKSCLKKINSKRGNYIGNFYFNIRDRCYKEQYPVVECDEIHTKLFIRRCIKYLIDNMKTRQWQWFDLPFFDDVDDFQFDEPKEFMEFNSIYKTNNMDFI